MATGRFAMLSEDGFFISIPFETDDCFGPSAGGSKCAVLISSARTDQDFMFRTADFIGEQKAEGFDRSRCFRYYEKTETPSLFVAKHYPEITQSDIVYLKNFAKRHVAVMCGMRDVVGLSPGECMTLYGGNAYSQLPTA